jgi:hypothetical protein
MLSQRSETSTEALIMLSEPCETSAEASALLSQPSATVRQSVAMSNGRHVSTGKTATAKDAAVPAFARTGRGVSFRDTRLHNRN